MYTLIFPYLPKTSDKNKQMLTGITSWEADLAFHAILSTYVKVVAANVLQIQFTSDLAYPYLLQVCPPNWNYLESLSSRFQLTNVECAIQ